MSQWSLQAVRQSLEPRGINVRRVEPYADGRCRFQVYHRDDPDGGYFSDDPEGCYVLALRRLTS